MKKVKPMYKIFSYIIAALAITSCASSYNIHGNASSSYDNGGMLYLKVLSPKDMVYVNIDSTEIVHGEFTFCGTVDSVCMSFVSTDRNALYPIVVESGDVKISDSGTGLSFGGTPLNDELCSFFQAYSQVKSDMSDLERRPYQDVLNGIAPNQALLQQDYNILVQRMDSLVTNFIKANFDNVLGPGAFQIASQEYPYPVLEPWIDDILSKATDTFKQNAYVKWYVEKAKEIEKAQNGMLDDSPSMPVTQPEENIEAAPTPNELAGTADSTKTK